MASSIGSRDSVSFLLTIQATGLLTFTLVGLPPTEYASLRWTHPHALRIPPRDGPPALRKTARIGSRSALAVSRFRLRARLGFSIPLPLSGPRGITPAFGYGAPHPSARGTSTPLNNALLSAHYELLRPWAPLPYSRPRGSSTCGFSVRIGVPGSHVPLHRL